MVQIKSAGYRVQNLESNPGLNEGSKVHRVTLSKLTSSVAASGAHV